MIPLFFIEISTTWWFLFCSRLTPTPQFLETICVLHNYIKKNSTIAYVVSHHKTKRAPYLCAPQKLYGNVSSSEKLPLDRYTMSVGKIYLCVKQSRSRYSMLFFLLAGRAYPCRCDYRCGFQACETGYLRPESRLLYWKLHSTFSISHSALWHLDFLRSEPCLSEVGSDGVLIVITRIKEKELGLKSNSVCPK